MVTNKPDGSRETKGKEVKQMEHEYGSGYCDICEMEVDYHRLVASKENMIEWLSCGHVLITRDNTVVQTYNYAEDNK